jgi:hypothetical protein
MGICKRDCWLQVNLHNIGPNFDACELSVRNTFDLMDREHGCLRCVDVCDLVPVLLSDSSYTTCAVHTASNSQRGYLIVKEGLPAI